MVDRPSHDRVPREFQGWIDEHWDNTPEEFRRQVEKLGLVAAAVRNIDRDNFERERDSWSHPNYLNAIDSKRIHGQTFLRAGLRDADPEIATLSVKWLPEYMADQGELRSLLVDCLQHSVPPQGAGRHCIRAGEHLRRLDYRRRWWKRYRSTGPRRGVASASKG